MNAIKDLIDRFAAGGAVLNYAASGLTPELASSLGRAPAHGASPSWSPTWWIATSSAATG